MKYLLLGLLISALAGCSSTSKLAVVDNFDAEKYMGTWYEAARYPHRFEKGMSNVSATYSLKPDGTIRVLNRGFVNDKNNWKEIEGSAKLKSSDNIGWLKVSFFKPFYASYKIIYLSNDYTQAIVTGPTYSYFWILSREKKLPAEKIDELIMKAEKLGFEKEKMLIVPQDLES